MINYEKNKLCYWTEIIESEFYSATTQGSKENKLIAYADQWMKTSSFKF